MGTETKVGSERYRKTGFGVVLEVADRWGSSAGCKIASKGQRTCDVGRIPGREQSIRTFDIKKQRKPNCENGEGTEKDAGAKKNVQVFFGAFH